MLNTSARDLLSCFHLFIFICLSSSSSPFASASSWHIFLLLHFFLTLLLLHSPFPPFLFPLVFSPSCSFPALLHPFSLLSSPTWFWLPTLHPSLYSLKSSFSSPPYPLLSFYSPLSYKPSLPLCILLLCPFPFLHYFLSFPPSHFPPLPSRLHWISVNTPCHTNQSRSNWHHVHASHTIKHGILSFYSLQIGHHDLVERVAALKLDNHVFTPEALRVGEEKSPKATNYILIISFLLKMELCHISTSSIITLKWAKLLSWNYKCC